MKTVIKILLVVFLAINLNAAEVVINKVEFLNQRDSVQLRFKTSGNISIPDIFYPEKDNLQRLVLRVKNVALKLDKKSFNYDSKIIKDVVFKENPPVIDIEINLLAEVNYRVFTNQEGLIIEFPIVREVYGVARENSSGPENKGLYLKNYFFEEKDNYLVCRFDFNSKPQFKEVPITEGPARFALDIIGLNHKKFSVDVNREGIKKLRGAYNNNQAYRLVFDLENRLDCRVEETEKSLLVYFPKQTTIARNLPNQSELLSLKEEAISKSEANITEEQKGVEKSVKSQEVEKPEYFGKERAAAPQREERDQVITGKTQYKGEPYDFVFKNADLINVLKFIARVSGLNIIVDPDVSGKVTCELYQVPWDQALDLFLKTNGLDMIQEGNILRIGKVDKLAAEAQQRQKLREAQMEELKITRTRTLSYVKASEVMDIVKKQLSNNGEVLTDTRSNTLIISDLPEKIKLIDDLLNILDVPNPQVQIEARIVEVSKSSLSSLGIQWNFLAAASPIYGNQTTLKFPNSIEFAGYRLKTNSPNEYMKGTNTYGYMVNLPQSESVIYPAISLGNVAGSFNIDLALSGLEKKGKIKWISSPKATAQNNKPANIKQGRKIPIQTIQNNTITTQYVDAALDLKVTPQITAVGSIIMELDISNDLPDFSTVVQGIPTINTQQIKTAVMTNDGSTIVIGGLYKVGESENSQGVPLLSKIPIIGNLFKNKYKAGEQYELLIFITPRIIK